MKKKIIAVISGTAILIIAAGSIYGKFESSHKEGEPDVVGTFSVNRDENITVVANREDIEDREAFARKLLQMYKDDSFHSTKFSTDRGYATSIDINIYLWKEDIEDGESVMTAEYRPVPLAGEAQRPDERVNDAGANRVPQNLLRQRLRVC